MIPTIGFKAMLRKELQQLRRSKRAMVTAVLMPAMFVLYFPLSQHYFMSPHSSAPSAMAVDVEPPGLQAVQGAPDVTFCAHASDAVTHVVIPGVVMRLSIDSRPPELVTDALGTACFEVPVPPQPGSYPIVPITSGRAVARIHPVYLVVREPGSGRIPTNQVPPGFPPPRQAVSTAPAQSSLPGFLANLTDYQHLFTRVMFPFFLILAAAMVPMSFAMQTVLLERERRTLPLLTALPIRVEDILAAKVVTTLLVAAAVMLPLFFIDLLVIGVDGLGGLGQLGLDLLVLLTGLVASAGTTLLLALVVKEIRTTGQLAGFLSLPAILILGAIVLLVPAPWNALVASALLLGVGAVSIFAAEKWITVERYLE